MALILPKRTTVAGRVPATLDIGEIATNLADAPPKLFVGTPAGVKQFFEAEAIEDADDDSVYGRCNGDWVPQPAVSATAPADPAPNTIWIDSTDMRSYLYYEEQWVELA